LKQLDLFEKTIKSPVIPDKYKYHDWTNIDHGKLRGLANKDKMQYHHFPYLIVNCKCNKDIKVYYRPNKPKLGNMSDYHTKTVSHLMEKTYYEIFYCPYCGRKLYIADGKIILIEVMYE
jgi:hypothetical protein